MQKAPNDSSSANRRGHHLVDGRRTTEAPAFPANGDPLKRITDKQKRRLIRKARALASADISRRVGKDPTSREVILKVIKGKGEMAIQARTGYLSPRNGPLYSISDLDVAESLDNPSHVVQIAAKIGFIALTQSMRLKNLPQGAAALTAWAEAAAKWLDLDVDALKAELADERAQAAADASPPPPAEQLELPLGSP